MAEASYHRPRDEGIDRWWLTDADSQSLWPFSVTGNANDVIGTNHGSVEGSPTIDANGLTCAGNDSGDNVNMGDVLDMLTADRSIFLRVKRNGTPSLVDQLVSKSKNAAKTGRWYTYISGSGTVVFGAQNSTDITSTTGVCDNSWHSVAITIDRDGLVKIYIDAGDAEDSATFLVTGDMDSGQNMRIGAQDNKDDINDPIHELGGSIDDVLIADRTWTQTEVQQLHDAGRGNLYVP